MKRNDLEKYLGKNVKVYMRSSVENNTDVYTGVLTKTTDFWERNLYYCKGDFSMEVRFRSSYVKKVKEQAK